MAMCFSTLPIGIDPSVDDLNRNKHAMTEKVVRFSDYERRSREPDAAQPRNPTEADVIILPAVRIERYCEQRATK